MSPAANRASALQFFRALISNIAIIGLSDRIHLNISGTDLSSVFENGYSWGRLAKKRSLPPRLIWADIVLCARLFSGAKHPKT
jgi:hypothetical protein